MKLSDFKGQEAFKVVGKLISILKELYLDENLVEIVKKREQGWIMDFFSESLEKRSDLWMAMFLALNPDKEEEDVTLSTVITFAYEFKNDPELMSLFFSQGDQTLKTSTGLPTENTEATEKISNPS